MNITLAVTNPLLSLALSPPTLVLERGRRACWFLTSQFRPRKPGPGTVELRSSPRTHHRAGHAHAVSAYDVK
ncbi:hypothetical protein AAFF_G00170000 [Aldrovandia affinis]|uniref:Uncharacterized protein n=1 Tax=Aldrovandia affinis TaxID=143900 RepID=A0AAD7RLZ4_9TELE|nr:hypothetical protein AAFF_G00170000 [Aldrovandia affinis]